MNKFKSLKAAAFNLTVSEKIEGNTLPLLNILKKEISKSKILQEQFNLDNKISKVEVADNFKILYINESLTYFNNVNLDEVKDSNDKLYEALIKPLTEIQKGQFDKLVKENSFTVDELIIESCKDRNDLTKKYKLIESYIQENNQLTENETVEEFPINEKILQSAISKFNEKYSFLNENEKDILNAFLYNDKSNIKDIFSKLIKESTNLIKRKLSELEDNETILENKYNKALLKLQEMKDQASIKIEDVIKLSELKNNI